MAEHGLVKYKETIADLQLVSKMYAESGFFKDAASVAKAFVKIQTGHEMGIPPMAAMTGIAIIQDKPVVGANILAAKVKMSGYDYRVRYLGNDGCKIEFFAKNGESLGMSEFMESDAKAAGLTGKDNWKKYARNMYFARAISNGQRWYCPDATSGTTVYTPDELGGKVDEEGNPVVDKQGNAVIDAEYTEIKREESQPEGEEEKFDREGALKDTELWLLEMAGNDEERFNALLRQVSEYTPKNGGASKWVMNQEHLQRVSDKWLNIIVHHAEERYNEFKAIQE